MERCAFFFKLVRIIRIIYLHWTDFAYFNTLEVR